MSSIYEEDLLGDPTTIEEIVEVELDEANESGDDANPDDPNAETEENAVPELQTAPEGVPVDPKKKRVVKNPQPKLNPARLMGPRGIAVLEETFKDLQYHGKGYEKSDLNQLMKRLEHWAHRLFPKFTFDDCLQKIENLGHKKEVKTYVKRMRMGLVNEIEPVALVEDVNEKDDVNVEPIDAFDALIGQQLSGSHQSQTHVSGIVGDSEPAVPMHTQPKVMTLTEEQKERMRQNRLLAEQRKLERLKALHVSGNTGSQVTGVTEDQPASPTDKNNINHQHSNVDVVVIIENKTSQYTEEQPPSVTAENNINHQNDNVNVIVNIQNNKAPEQRTKDQPPSATDEDVNHQHSNVDVNIENKTPEKYTDEQPSSATDENNINHQNVNVDEIVDIENNIPEQHKENQSVSATDENKVIHQNSSVDVVVNLDNKTPDQYTEEQPPSTTDENNINQQNGNFDAVVDVENNASELCTKDQPASATDKNNLNQNTNVDVLVHLENKTQEENSLLMETD